MASTLKIDTITTPDGTGNITVSRPLSGSGASLTSLPAANLTGTLPAIDGSSLTGLSSGSAKNIIINGDFNIWQKGTNVVGATNGDFAADRWKWVGVGAGVVDMKQSTDVPTVAESGILSQYSMLIDCTTADASIAATDQYRFQYAVEGYDYAKIAQKDMTLSFWHKHTTAGTYNVVFNNSGNNRSYAAEYTQTVTDTWEKAEITVTASPSAGTWDYTNGQGLKIHFINAIGTNWQATAANTWESAERLSSSGGASINNMSSASNSFRLAQVQLETGSVATDFEVRDYATELAMCKRYFEKLNNIGNVNWRFGAAQCVSTNVARGVIRWEVEKRAAPTITSSAVDYFSLTQSNYAKEAVTALSFATPDVWSTRADISVAGNLAAGDVTLLESDASNAATIDISAEL